MLDRSIRDDDITHGTTKVGHLLRDGGDQSSRHDVLYVQVSRECKPVQLRIGTRAMGTGRAQLG
jgi:hypothetical protein